LPLNKKMRPRTFYIYKSRVKNGVIKQARLRTLVKYGLFNPDDNVSLFTWRTATKEPVVPVLDMGVRSAVAGHLDARAAVDDGKTTSHTAEQVAKQLYLPYARALV